jgi:hypothetical protein
MIVRGHSRARSFRVPKDFSSCFRGDQTTLAFAVQDGKVQEVVKPYVVIQEWKIVLRGLDDHEVIFEWPDRKP